MSRQHVVIVGGGLAGMAAAEALSHFRKDLRITLLESKRILGGRAGSYIDPETESEVDYCQHAAMGCCTNLIDLLTRCQLDQHLRRYRELTFLHPNHPPSRFTPSRWLPAPLHLLGTINSQRYLNRRAKREIKQGLWKLMRTSPAKLADVLATDWLAAAGQHPDTIRQFWDVILVSALGERTERVSMAAARKVLIDGFAIARGASDVLVPTRPLADLFGRMLAKVLSDRGVEVRTGIPVRQITPDARITIADPQADPNSEINADAVICAVPWHQVKRLFDDWSERQQEGLPNWDDCAEIPGSPISGLHLWFDAPITDLDHAVLVGTVAQWLFRDPCLAPAICLDPPIDATKTAPRGEFHYYQVVISASADATSRSKESLLETVLGELRHAFPAARRARLVRHRLVTDPNSVFSIGPQVERLRPSARTRLPWLTLAGDWTQTGWPATMEGAVISGRLAAKIASESIAPTEPGGCPMTIPFVREGMTPGYLARWLIRA